MKIPFTIITIIVTMLFGSFVVTHAAIAQELSLNLKHTHTGKAATIVFKRDGAYDSAGIAALNLFLADWRNGKQTNMDPALFDILWQVYHDVGATQPINIVSSYRSPETNAMLRKTSSGVAENSQHINGKAIDFFIPGVPLDVLRVAAMRLQGGGVGYYPSSGSPFIHIDTGSVRAWPRMTTAQLKAIFPDGNTRHLPSDGPALPRTVIAAADPIKPQEANRPRTLVDLLFGNSRATAPQAQPAGTIKPVVGQERLQPSSPAIALAETQPPMPVPRPVNLNKDIVVVAEAPIPRPRPAMLADKTLSTTGEFYPLMGYAAASISTPASLDPFSFVNDLPTSIPIKSSDGISPVDAEFLRGESTAGVGFATLQAPIMSNIRFLIYLDATPTTKQVVPRRF